jgi:aspartate carbamoyltransferase catalytic subunit
VGRLDGLHVVFAGDLRYGRAVHSLVTVLALFDARITLVSPGFLRLPEEQLEALESLGVSYGETETLEEALPDADVLYMTRVQRERFTDPLEYERFKDAYRLDLEVLKHAPEKLAILHPLPRVTEIAPEVDARPHAAYFRQAHYGVAVRKALIALLLGRADEVLR